MSSDAEKTLEPDSIKPGELLRIAVKNELAPPLEGAPEDDGNDGAFRKRLEATLKAWQGSKENGGLPYVSFATAFPITGKAIAGVPINPLKPPGDSCKQETYSQVFLELTKPPGKPSYGKWPWDMMRDGLQDN